MTDNRSTLPWKHIQLADGYEVVSATGDQVCHGFEYDMQPPTTDDAAFMVTACNAHSDLVNALKALISLHSYKTVNGKDEYYLAHQPRLWLQAEAAVAKARGEA